jgi:hypothetical protein
VAAIDRESILEAVHHLPPEEQRALALEILRALAPMPTASIRRELPPAPDPRSASALALRGIAKTDKPIDDVRSLDESRTERFS